MSLDLKGVQETNDRLGHTLLQRFRNAYLARPIGGVAKSLHCAASEKETHHDIEGIFDPSL